MVVADVVVVKYLVVVVIQTTEKKTFDSCSGSAFECIDGRITFLLLEFENKFYNIQRDIFNKISLLFSVGTYTYRCR